MCDLNLPEYLTNLIQKFPRSYFNIISSQKNTEIYSRILKQTEFLNDKSTVKNEPFNTATRCFYVLNNLSDFVKCKHCGKPILKNLKPFDNPNFLFCSNKCAQSDPINKQKIKQAKLAKFGNENYNGKDKAKRTCLEKYGVESYCKTKEFKEKSKATLIEHYGCDHYMKSKIGKETVQGFKNNEIRDKVKKSNLEKYGVEYPAQSKEIRNKMHINSVKTKRGNYYDDFLMCYDGIKPNFSKEFYISNNNDHLFEYEWKCEKCGDIFKSRIIWGSLIKIRCPKCNPPIMSQTSSYEKDLKEFIQSLGFTVELNNRDIISPKEIDLVVKDKDKIILCIEIDGIYWHSTFCGKDKFYHLAKTKECENKGYRLIHIFEDEWLEKPEIVKDKIRNILNKTEIKIDARKCHVKEISNKECNEFLNKTHIQGACNSKYRFGLFYKDELIAVISFSKPRKVLNGKPEDGLFELLRYSTKLNSNVRGGFSKLLSYAYKQMNIKSLISYCDLRWSNGKSYLKNGFNSIRKSHPNCWYFDKRNQNKRLHRFNFRKNLLENLLPNFDKSKTEIQNMENNGYGLIWDCGNLVFKK